MRNVFAVAALMIMCCGTASAELVQPAPINLPAGGIVTTEISLTDGDVLGLLKQAIPAIADAAKQFMAEYSARSQPKEGAKGMRGDAAELSKLAAVDVKGLMEAVDGIKAIRVLIAQYPRGLDTRRFMAEFDMGVGKLGKFSKVVGDVAFFPGAAAVYAEQGNGGYVAYAYGPDGYVYAARIVGSVDVAKLVNWIGKTAVLFMPMYVPDHSENDDQAAPDGGAPADKPESGN